MATFTPAYPFSDKSNRVIGAAWGAFQILEDSNYDFGDADGSNTTGSTTRGILIKTDGILRVLMANGQDVTFPAGTFATNIIHPLMVKRLISTDTTATDIYGFF